MNQSELQILRTELDTDPLTRGYAGFTDQQKADDLNTAYRDGPANPGALFEYFSTEGARDNGVNPLTPILGRLRRIDDAGNAGITQKTFGADANNQALTDVGLDSCRTLLAIAMQDRINSLEILTNSPKLEALLNAARDVGAIDTNDVNNIKALSDNRQTRAQELEIPRVRVGDIEAAEAL